jgi:adenosylcobinamide kinase/adenosylcobinamide-phosphate guanylyltransferase
VFERDTGPHADWFTFSERKLRLPPLTLVLGGAASGKSAFAQKLLRQSGLAKTFVATADACDPDLADSIAQSRRARIGEGWHTVEAPLTVSAPIALLDADEAAVLDCIALWLENLVVTDANWSAEVELLCDVLVQLPAPVVMVSAEVGGRRVPDGMPPSEFDRVLGQVNQRLAAMSDLVVHMTAGLPRVIKGHALAEAEPWD